jgi:hypothetical protein
MLLRNKVNQRVSLVKQVLPNAGEIDLRFDAEAFKQASIPNSGELQKLRGLKRA